MPYYENSNRGFLSQIPPVTRNLLLINIILFVATLVNEEFMLKTFALFYPASPLFRPWQLLTHMFMHGGWMHILFNMYALVTFGSILENNIGSRKFLVFYFVSGFGAVLLHLGVEYLQALSWSKSQMTFGRRNGAFSSERVTSASWENSSMYRSAVVFCMMRTV